MTHTEKMAELLFPQITGTPADIEARYPARQLPEGAKVTRLAPSPTGYIHIGSVYQAMIDERLAHQSGGVFYLRIEDTDARREVSGAAEAVLHTLEAYGIRPDEGMTLDADGKLVNRGAYGPYKQSERAEIYQTYAKQLVKEGKAYPVFTSPEELEKVLATDKKTENKTKDWEATAEEARREMLENRKITPEQAEEALKAGHSFVLRILADGDGEQKQKVTDLIKGDLELPVNDEDFVLLKSDGIPTYHFAHAVDDHLMGTTHVVRGEEWLPSLPKHLQLFRYLGFRAPKYLHTAQVLRMEENGAKKKLSKRDLGAGMADYAALGYPPEGVIEYLLTLLNSNYEEWRTANPDAPYTDFPFSIKKMSGSGCLVDFDKLGDISRNVVARMTAEQVYANVQAWAEEYDAPFAEALRADPARSIAIFAIGRGGKKPRKDFGNWKEAKEFVRFFFPAYFEIEEPLTEYDPADVKAVLERFLAVYDPSDDADVWFEKVKQIATELGYCTDRKAYKANPEAYRGSVADVSAFLRVALTGRRNSPDLHAVMQALGREETVRRIRKYCENM